MGIENVRQVAVVGAGNMGAQIAQLMSQVAGYRVTITDTTRELVETGLKRQRENMQKFFVDKKKITAAEMEAALGRIKGTPDLAEAVKNADFVVEAIFENLALKKELFQKLDVMAPPHAILASNTSMLSVTEMAAVTKRPEKVAGMHFFNPVLVMKLVEVVRAPLTAEDTAKTVYEMAKKLGKEPVYCRDTYGFLANRANISRGDALDLVMAKIAPPGDIDKAMRLGFNYPMGSLERGDMTGAWGIQAHGEQDAIRELGFEKGHVHPLIRMMVRAGYTGGPGKKGIYDFWNDVLSKW